MQEFCPENITYNMYAIYTICQFKPNLSPIAIRWSDLKINIQKMYLSLQLIQDGQTSTGYCMYTANIYKDGNEESFKMIRIEFCSKYR